MERLLGSFHFDRLSFWLGFLAANLFWWLLGRLRPLLSLGRDVLKERARSGRSGLATSSETRFRQDMLRFAQRQHLAASFFSLDEIILVPSLQAAHLPVDPGAPPPLEDISTQTLPELPDWPELAAAYGGNTFSFVQALSKGANLVITGLPGSGKTVALAYFASHIARQDPGVEEMADRIPLLLHVNDLPHLARRPEDDPFEVLVEAASAIAPSLPAPRLAEVLRTTIVEGRLILLLDGLDEYPATEFNEVVDFLVRLLQTYSTLQVVTTAQPDFYPGLVQSGFIPLALSGWNIKQRKEFIHQWGLRWNQITPITVKEAAGATSLILDEWLLNDPIEYTPFELTLKVWAAHAGDTLGPTALHAIEAHLRRLTASIPKGRLALEKMAAQMALSQRPFATRTEAGSWLAEVDPTLGTSFERHNGNAGNDEVDRVAGSGLTISSTQEPVTTTRVLPLLIENGLLRNFRDDRLSLAHPVLAGYLAGCGLNSQIGGAQLLAGKDGGPLWMGSLLALDYLLARNDTVQLVARFLEGDTAPLHLDLITAARWLRNAPENYSWRSSVLRRLAGIFQNDSLPVALRARAMVALALSSGPGAAVFFRQILASRDPGARKLAALGLGLTREVKAVDDLEELLTDPGPTVRRAACLALVHIGNKNALDAIAGALLHGDEDLRCAAAEALANHAEEGHPILLEGSRLEDLGVRRATIYGLHRIGESWAEEALHKMQMEDEQWVVKNAAEQALEERSHPDLRIPQPRPLLNLTPWLIAFASERGLGVAPGKPAVDLLLLAMQEGNEDQRLAALDLAGRLAEIRSVPVVGEICANSEGELFEMAFTTLWRLSAAGVARQPETVLRIE